MSLTTNRLRRSPGFSLVEIMIVIAIILVIITIAIPNVTAKMMLGNETAALANIRTIQSAQAQYISQFGRYATSLIELGPPASGNAGPSAAGLISADFSQGVRSGYRRTFFADQTMTIFQNWG